MIGSNRSEVLYLETIAALDKLVSAFIYILPTPRMEEKLEIPDEDDDEEEYKRKEEKLRRRRARIARYVQRENLLLGATRSNTDDFSDLPEIVKRVSKTMEDVYYNMDGDVDEYIRIRKKVDELGSVLKIGRAHTDSAIERAKKIGATFRSGR